MKFISIKKSRLSLSRDNDNDDRKSNNVQTISDLQQNAKQYDRKHEIISIEFIIYRYIIQIACIYNCET